MFRKHRIGKIRYAYISLYIYIKESIQAYEIKFENEAESEEAIWCNTVTGNSTLTVGLVYRNTNISIGENVKIQVSKKGCVIIGDFKAAPSTRLLIAKSVLLCPDV